MSPAAENAVREDTRSPAPWEKKRLGDVAKRITRKNTKLESELPLTISAEHGLINQYEFFNNRVAARDVSGYYLVYKGEFAYNKSTSDGWPWGVVKQLKYYPKGVLSTLYIVFAINEKELDAEYVEMYFETTLWHYDVSIRAAEGARNHGLLNITASDFLETTLHTPSLPEQKKIGAYFRSLEALIAEREKALEKLGALKKSMLLKMFPQGDATVPEVRFKGFAGEWEKKRLGDVAESFDYGLNAAAKLYDGRNKYIRITDINDQTHRYCRENAVSPDCNVDEAKDSIVRKNDILFARTGASVGKTYLYNEEDGLLFFAGFLIRANVKKEYDADFVFYSTLTERYRHFVELTSQRSGQPGINADEYQFYSFLVPTFIEQQKIGAFFRSLDALLVSRREEIGKLKQMKKALLERMFV